MDRILVTEKIAPEGIAALRAAAQVDVRLDLNRDQLLQVLPEYDALVVRSATKVTSQVIAAGSRLRVIGRAGSGVDNIDVDAATARGIVVVNAPASNSVAVAELTIGLMIALARHIHQAHASLAGGTWDRNSFMGSELRGKTLGLVGLGRIGSEVARRARAFDMQVLAYDPLMAAERAIRLGVEPVELDALLTRSDVISLHVPALDSTRGLFNAERIAQMKTGAVLVNAARGGIVDEAALLEALNSGKLAGAALDVFEYEPPRDFTLANHPKVVATPHLGASTAEAQTLTGVDVAEGVVAALRGEMPRYAVNTPFVPPEQTELLMPYISLGRQLGRLCTQLVHEPVRGYELVYAGELAQQTTLPVRLAVLQGLLAETNEGRVTPVNAPLLAKERGLYLAEQTSSEAESYNAMIVLRALTADGPHEFAGTIVRHTPTVIEADGYWVSFEPVGHLLFTYHRDRPGMIGRVGTLLGQADVNISGMHVGRLGPRQQAMMVLTLDDPVPSEVLEMLRAEPDIQRAVGVTL